jgi:hypothetical protein
MLSLLFILLITGICVYISSFFSAEYSWQAYYMGGNVGLLISSLVLYIWNEKRRREELKKEKPAKKDYL